jgi:hypothetical protein
MKKTVILSYKKRREDVNKIVGNFNRDDYQMLLDRDACQSFNRFHEAIHS